MPRQSARVLLIDDDKVYAEVFTHCARAAGYEVTWHESLEDLGWVAMVGRYDLAILDYNLGATTGREIAQYVDAFFANIPVIMISASPENLSVGRTWPHCVKGWVDKSQGLGVLVGEMERHLAPTKESWAGPQP